MAGNLGAISPKQKFNENFTFVPQIILTFFMIGIIDIFYNILFSYEILPNDWF